MEEQKRLFEIIKSKLSEQLNLADTIEELLNVSSDSAYRRIRGETELTFSELKTICEKFNLSMDEFLHLRSNQGVLFQYTPVDLSNQESYLIQLKQRLSFWNQLKSASVKKCYYTATDVPFFHYYKYPELAFFRLFAWNEIITRSTVSFSEFCNGLEKERIILTYRFR